MYFELEIEIGQKYGVKKWPELPEGVFAFQSGVLVTVDIPQPLEFIVDYTKEHPPIDFVTSFMPVFSDRLVEAFRKSGADNFQVYDAILHNPDSGEKWEGYKVVNVIGKISCADLEKSVYDRPDGMNYNFKELVIDVAKANGALLFRLLESPRIIVVHNRVLDQMYTEDDDPIFEGVDFRPIKSSHNIE